jgi:hypothetical protein
MMDGYWRLEPGTATTGNGQREGLYLYDGSQDWNRPYGMQILFTQTSARTVDV